VAGVYLVNRGREDRRTGDDVLLPEATARVIGVVGVLAVVTGLFLFLVPGAAIAIWPWKLTPLTARVMGALFTLGLAAVGAFRERRWSAAKLLVQVEVVMLVLLLASGLRAAGDFAPGNVLTWLFAVGFVGVLAASIGLYVQMERRTRHRTPVPA
jgi:hypothetical protein